jgi:hypothetical protein
MHLLSTQTSTPGRIRLRLLTAVVGILAGAGSQALAVGQTRPVAPVDFTGKWVFDEARTKALRGPSQGREASGGSAAMPVPDLAIVQTATTLTIEFDAFDRVHRTVYDLTGKESTNKSGAVTEITTSKWSGRTLVTEGRASQVTSQGYEAWTVRQTRSIDASGALVLESTHTDPGGRATTSTVVFKRQR